MDQQWAVSSGEHVLAAAVFSRLLTGTCAKCLNKTVICLILRGTSRLLGAFVWHCNALTPNVGYIAINY